MLDKYFNPNPTIYKWDRFSVGFIPSILLPVIVFFAFYGFTWFQSVYIQGASFSFSLFLHSMNNQTVFLKTSTLCCIPNAALFFFFIKRDYYNASRAVIVATMLLIIAIVIKDMI